MLLFCLFFCITGERECPATHELRGGDRGSPPAGRDALPRRRDATRDVADDRVHPQEGVRRGLMLPTDLILSDGSDVTDASLMLPTGLM